MKKEAFRKISDTYQISNQGRIKSLPKYHYTIHGGYITKEKILKSSINRETGYLSVHMHQKTYIIHRLVAETFIPNPENKPTVNHKDGNKLNNNDWNLEWATYKENINHSINMLGNNFCGENHGRSKLKNNQIKEIREKYSTGNYSQYQLAKEYNITRSAIYMVIKNKLWKTI